MERAFHTVVHAWREEIIRDRKLPHKRRDSQKSSYPRLASNHVASLGVLVLNLVKYRIYYDPKVIFWGKEDWGEKPSQMRRDSGVQDRLEENRLEHMNLALASRKL